MPIKNFDKVELLLPMTGANNGTVFTDYSLRQRAVTRTGAVITSTAQSKFSAYGSSGYFPGSGSCLSTDQLLPESGDFFIGGWVRRDAAGAAHTFFSQRARNSSNNEGRLTLGVNDSNVIRLFIGGTPNVSIAGSTTLGATTWGHVAASRSGNVFRVFLNGVQENSTEVSRSVEGAVSHFGVASFTAGGAPSDSLLAGYLQDWIIVGGSPVYTANFTPPARMTQRELTRVNTGTDSHEFDRAILFDWNAGGNSVSHAVTPDASGDFVADDLIDLEYGVAMIKDGCGPECRGPVTVDPDT